MVCSLFDGFCVQYVTYVMLCWCLEGVPGNQKKTQCFGVERRLIKACQQDHHPKMRPRVEPYTEAFDPTAPLGIPNNGSHWKPRLARIACGGNTHPKTLRRAESFVEATKA